MRISDWSSDVCSSDLRLHLLRFGGGQVDLVDDGHDLMIMLDRLIDVGQRLRFHALGRVHHQRSEEHTYELQSLMRISYAVFCLKKKKITYIRSFIKSSHVLIVRVIISLRSSKTCYRL